MLLAFCLCTIHIEHARNAHFFIVYSCRIRVNCGRTLQNGRRFYWTRLWQHAARTYLTVGRKTGEILTCSSPCTFLSIGWRKAAKLEVRLLVLFFSAIDASEQFTSTARMSWCLLYTFHTRSICRIISRQLQRLPNICFFHYHALHVLSPCSPADNKKG